MRPMKFFLPGIFLLVLGIGNISVGTFKRQQYSSVLKELSVRESTTELVNVSPLRRIQLAKQNANRNYERIGHARARRDFYGLVTFGGEVFIGLSAVFLLISILLRLKSPIPEARFEN